MMMSMHSHHGRPHLIISLTTALAIVALVIITIQTYSTYFADNVDNNDNDNNHNGRNNNDRRQLRPCGNERDNPAWHPTTVFHGMKDIVHLGLIVIHL